MAKKLTKAEEYAEKMRLQVCTTKAELLEAMANNRCLVATCCKIVGISRTTFYKYTTEDADFKAAIDELQEIEIDGVEDKFGELIDAGNPSSIMFYLRTKGKSRGYGDKLEVSGEIGIGSIEIVKPTDKDE